MCRLLGSRSAAPILLDRLLLDSKASLFVLSQEHRHGWGIGQYRGGEPVLRRGTAPAFEDPEFARVARAVESECVVAHIRRRSVGEFSVEDNHPFQHGRFLFAHNGTIQRFDEHKAALEALIAPGLRRDLRGTTDSERCFFVMVSRLQARGAYANPSMEDLADAVAHVISAVRAFEPGADKHHMLTFLVSDGRNLLGVRAGEKELWLSTHRRDSLAGAHDHVFLASEPLSEEDQWELVGDGAIVGIGPDLRVRRWTLGDFTSAKAA